MSELMGILGMGMAFLAGFLLGGLRRRGKTKEEEGTLEENKTDQRQEGIARRGKDVGAQGTDEWREDDSEWDWAGQEVGAVWLERGKSPLGGVLEVRHREKSAIFMMGQDVGR